MPGQSLLDVVRAGECLQAGADLCSAIPNPSPSGGEILIYMLEV